MKIHLRDGSCKPGERGLQVPHLAFVESEDRACLLCARGCDCAACHDLLHAWGSCTCPNVLYAVGRARL